MKIQVTPSVIVELVIRERVWYIKYSFVHTSYVPQISYINIQAVEAISSFLLIICLNYQYKRYTKSKEDESSSNSLDVLQRSRIQLYLNCNSKEDTKSSTSLHQIKHCTSKVKHIYIDTFCSSVHPTICLTWIVQIKPDLQRG